MAIGAAIEHRSPLVAADPYLANLAALYRIDPKLALALDELPAAAMLPLEPSRAGPPTAAVILPEGRRLYLHSRYEPLDEARQFCRALDDAATSGNVAAQGNDTATNPGQAAGAGNGGAGSPARITAEGGRATSVSGTAEGGRVTSVSGTAEGGRVTSVSGTAEGGRATSVLGTAGGGCGTSVSGTAEGGRVTSVSGTAEGGRATSVLGTAGGGCGTSVLGTAEGGCATSAVWSVVLCGLGLGHHLAPLRERLGPEGVLIVAEPDVVTIKTALSLYDISDDLLAGRIVMLWSADKAELHRKLDPAAALLMLGLRFVAPPAYRQLHAAFFNEMRRLITDYAAYTRMSLVTLVANARITATNVANNLPWYVATPPIDALRNRFRGRPAVVVAAGPSLGRNVEQLRDVGDGAVIIAVQTSLKPLLARGIRPHYVTSLDFSDLSKRFFEGVDLSGVELIAEPKASWQVLDTFFSGEPGAFEPAEDGEKSGGGNAGGDNRGCDTSFQPVNGPNSGGMSQIGCGTGFQPVMPAGEVTGWKPVPQRGAGVPARQGEHGGSHDEKQGGDGEQGGSHDEKHRPPRAVRLLNNDFAARCIGPALAQRGGLRAGSTVAHLSFYLAEYLGCDPIILIGQDLGFSGGVYYTPGVAMHDAWRPELGTFCSLEQKEWERIVRARPILHRAIDVHGAPIYTDDQMFTYLQQFERDFAASPATVIDATEGGVAKRGTRPMKLADALRQYAAAAPEHAVGCVPDAPVVQRGDASESREPTPCEEATLTAALAPGGRGSSDRIADARPALDPGRLSTAAAELKKRLDDLAEFEDLCKETRTLLTEMQGLLDRPGEFDRRIVRVDELRALVDQRQTIFRMVSDVAQLAELQKFTADRRLALDRARAGDGAAGDGAGGESSAREGSGREGSGREGPGREGPGGDAPKRESKFELPPEERARRQLQRDGRFVSALLEGCDVLRRILSQALERTKALQSELAAEGS